VALSAAEEQACSVLCVVELVRAEVEVEVEDLR
jgi:hypothetical protein